MNNHHISGGIKDVKGKVKENLGHVTGNDRMEGEGVIDQVAGKLQQTFGDIKDRVKDAVDRVLEKKPDAGPGSRRSA